MKLGLISLVAMAIAIAAPAKAVTYHVVFNGPIYDADLLVKTNAANLATSISGTQTGLQGGVVTSLVSETLSPKYGFFWDNLLTGTPNYLTLGGLMWNNSDGSIANLFLQGTDYHLYGGSGSSYYFDDIGKISVSAVPLPSALPLLAAGLLGLGGIALRRRKSAA